MPIQQVLPPNRIALIASVLTSLTAFITGLAKTLPGSWENYALAATGLLGQVLATIKFLEGSQKFDALQSRERLEYIRRGQTPPASIAPSSIVQSPVAAYVSPAQDE